MGADGTCSVYNVTAQVPFIMGRPYGTCSVYYGEDAGTCSVYYGGADGTCSVNSDGNDPPEKIKTNQPPKLH